MSPGRKIFTINSNNNKIKAKKKKKKKRNKVQNYSCIFIFLKNEH